MKNKTCAKCNESKPLTEFYKTKTYTWEKDGHDYYCKYCRTGSALKSHRGGVRKKKCSIEDCERLHYAKTFCRVHYSRNLRNGTTEILNYRREAYGNTTYENVRKGHLKRRYQLTPEEYEEMAKDGCHICGKEALPYKYLHLDHDHKCCSTETSCGLCVRGILCDACNTAVGKYENDKMREDYPFLNEIIAYVAKHDKAISGRMISNDKRKKR